MSVLDFIASLISALAWPLAACGIALLFRQQLTGLLSVAGPLRRLKGPGGLEAFYDETILEAEQSAAEALEAAGVSGSPVSGRLVDLRTLAHDHPAAAIVEASRRIEVRLDGILRSVGVHSRPASMSQLAQDAYKQGLIDDMTFRLIMDLRTLRNLAVHGGRKMLADGTEVDIDATRALEFLSIAEVAIASLDRHREP